MADQKLLDGIKEADIKLFALCYICGNGETSSIDFEALAKELDCRSEDPKKAINAIKERIRSAKTRLPAGTPSASAGGINKKRTTKTSPTKRKAAGSNATDPSTPKKPRKKAVKNEEADNANTGPNGEDQNEEV